MPTRLLIVDDDPMIRAFLEQALAAQPYVVTPCSNAEAALERLREQPIDLVLIDLRLPGISGMDLLETTGREFPHCALIVITASDDVKTALSALRRGACDYLVKPLDPEIVLSNMERALQKKRTEMELDLYRRHLEHMVEERTRRLEESSEQIIKALGTALDLRDSGTAGHSLRVCLYALELARVMGCGDDQIQDLMRGAFLHDIGKMAIPDVILMKPGPLTPEERRVMQSHVRIGHGFISNVTSLQAAAELTLCHHERYDGSGYPQGLRGEAIPVQARIFAVVDAFDAMTSQRPYRSPMTFAAAIAELQREAGSQFDPQAVAAFLRVPHETWRQIQQSADESTARRIEQSSPHSGTAPHSRVIRPGDSL